MSLQTIIGLFDELEKIGGLVDRAVGKILANAADKPANYIGRAMSADLNAKKDYNDAIQRGYPASWVALGVRPPE